jgi:hypothetical protein
LSPVSAVLHGAIRQLLNIDAGIGYRNVFFARRLIARPRDAFRTNGPSVCTLAVEKAGSLDSDRILHEGLETSPKKPPEFAKYAARAGLTPSSGWTVIDRTRLPGLPAQGPIGFRHHPDQVHFASLLREPQESATTASAGGRSSLERVIGEAPVEQQRAKG